MPLQTPPSRYAYELDFEVAPQSPLWSLTEEIIKIILLLLFNMTISINNLGTGGYIYAQKAYLVYKRCLPIQLMGSVSTQYILARNEEGKNYKAS